MNKTEALTKFAKDELNIDLDKLHELEPAELADIYERACDLEVDIALEAPDGSDRGEMAAALVDYLYYL